MRAWPYVPGVPAAGHVTASGFWHPGRVEGCVKCEPSESRWVCPAPGCGVGMPASARKRHEALIDMHRILAEGSEQ